MQSIQIFERQSRPDPALIARLRALPVANISDVMARLTAGGASLRPFHDGTAMAGAALTVKTRPGDNLLVHKALQMAEPGDVVVVDAGGDLSNAIVGDLMTSFAASRKLGGIVIFGAVRDADALRANALPVYACGVTHRGPYKDGPGRINVPIAIDGMVIEPGDIIVGDADGILCVPLAQAEQIATEATEKHAQELQTVKDIAGGQLDASWIDIALQRQGYVRGD